MKPWEKKWEKIPDAEVWTGRQGNSRCVKKKGSDSNEVYVLKILNRQKDIERRSRMYREVASLKTVEHSGVPDLIETNAEKFEDLDEYLYLVLEYIPGNTLSDFIKNNGSLEPKIAHKFFLVLLDVLDYCHQRDISHRDLKPDNVILRKNNPSEPVLIDFGQSFNLDPDLNDLTPDWQHLGNRFLSLPEYSSPASNSRDPRSDITVCCGLFLYALTGEIPTNLINDQGEMPHQIPAIKSKLLKINYFNGKRLMSFFNQAFNVHIDYRFQSISALKQSLIFAVDNEEEKNRKENLDNKIRTLKNSGLSEGDQKRLSNIKEVLNQTDQEVKRIVRDLMKDLGSNYSSMQGNFNLNMQKFELKNNLGLVNNLIDKKFFPRFLFKIKGTEVVITVEFDNNLKELLRLPFSNPELDSEQKKLIKDFFISELESKINSGR